MYVSPGPELGLDPEGKGGRRHRASAAGTVHFQVDEPLVIELDQLDIAAVGVQCGPDGVEDILNLRENLRRHGLPFACG